AVAGAAGGLLACAAGTAGRHAVAYAPGRRDARTYPDLAYLPGPYNPSPASRPAHDATNPYKRPLFDDGRHGGHDRYSAPTEAGHPLPPPRPGRRPRGSRGYGSSLPEEGPPPPPGAPPPPPRGRR
ncbi:hypothetical protein J7E86_11495, partial [Streptomyces sp. ISL-11]|nr:hypothetical protein [Streptomyces sp. ISL-11]